jgi:ubiquinone/menaquinone biosynthesis C-methylase UbiE
VNREPATHAWYRDYYQKKGTDRNDLRTNPAVLFQNLAGEESIVRAMRDVTHDPRTAAVLDIGCGDGGDLFDLLRVHYDPEKITGIDILSDRVAQARKMFPHVRFLVGDASRLEFADDSFDLVYESTMFATVTDNDLAAAIGREMVRVCKAGGYLCILDWRTPKPYDSNYNALTKKHLRRFFAIGEKTQWLGMYRGALVPPLGRFLSKWAPSLYFLVRACFPVLCGQVVYLLRKRGGA